MIHYAPLLHRRRDLRTQGKDRRSGASGLPSTEVTMRQSEGAGSPEGGTRLVLPVYICVQCSHLPNPLPKPISSPSPSTHHPHFLCVCVHFLVFSSISQKSTLFQKALFQNRWYNKNKELTASVTHYMSYCKYSEVVIRYDSELYFALILHTY